MPFFFFIQLIMTFSPRRRTFYSRAFCGQLRELFIAHFHSPRVSFSWCAFFNSSTMSFTFAFIAAEEIIVETKVYDLEGEEQLHRKRNMRRRITWRPLSLVTIPSSKAINFQYDRAVQTAFPIFTFSFRTFCLGK